MFALAHLGIGLGLAWVLTSRRATPIDYRWVLLGAILPDVIDKPLGFLLLLQGRLWAHTLLFLIGLLAASRIPRLRNLQWVGFGVATHLLLDEMWAMPWVLFWPLDGPFHPSMLSVYTFLHTLLTDPVIQAGEIVGAACLVAIAWVCGIRSRETLGEFLRSGRLARRTPDASKAS